jgi:hypothetical protein
VHTERTWQPAVPGARGAGAAALGRWRLARRAFIDAWGEGGVGVRAVLDSSQLAAFLDELIAESAGVGAPTTDARLEPDVVGSRALR